jgi:hypothetical protein
MAISALQEDAPIGAQIVASCDATSSIYRESVRPAQDAFIDLG